MYNNNNIMNTEFKVLRQEVSTRGGGIEIDLQNYGYEGGKMTAYQNYLGGGMLGAIQSDCNIRDWRGDNELVEVSSELMRYFHSLTNHDWDEWEDCTFEQTQLRPSSAY